MNLWRLLMSFILAVFLLAADDAVFVALGKWKITEGKPVLSVELAAQVRPKQRKLIDSGFSTYSLVQVSTLDEASKDDPKSIHTVQCTVKFDLWEEVYEVTRIAKGFKTIKTAKFDDYARHCLTAEIAGTAIMDSTQKKGGNINARLQIRQISQQKAEVIREWLVKQQSGVLQGLFSHMLGDLKLNEETDILVQIPPRSASRPQSGVIAISPSVDIL